MLEKVIFISYRRDDSVIGAIAPLLKTMLERDFPGQVFRDSESIRKGRDIGDEIHQALANCEIMLVCMNEPDKWMNPGHGSIQDEKDWVRQEVEMALREDIAVVPVWFTRYGSGERWEDHLPAAKLPESIRRLVNLNAERIDIGKDDWASHQFPRLVERLKDERETPLEKQHLADQVLSLLKKIAEQSASSMPGGYLAKSYFLCAGLERVPEALKNNTDRLSLLEIVGLLKLQQGNQIYEFVRQAHRYYRRVAPHNRAIIDWFETQSLPLGPESAGAERLRIQFVLLKKPQWTSRASAIQIHGTMRLGSHELRLPTEDFPEVSYIEGQSEELMLEPIFRALHDYLLTKFGQQLLNLLEPRMEFFARAGQGQLDWPLERTALSDYPLGGVYPLAIRIYERHIDTEQEQVRNNWRLRSQSIQDRSLVENEFLIAVDWDSLIRNPRNREIAFAVVDGSTPMPAIDIISKAYPLGIWIRTAHPDASREAALGGCQPQEKLCSLLDVMTEDRRSQCSVLHEIAVLDDPCEEPLQLPHDPDREPYPCDLSEAISFL